MGFFFIASAVLGGASSVRSMARQVTGAPRSAPFLSQDDSRQSICQVSPAARTHERISTVTRSSATLRNGSFSGFSTNAESMLPPRVGSEPVALEDGEVGGDLARIGDEPPQVVGDDGVRRDVVSLSDGPVVDGG